MVTFTSHRALHINGVIEMLNSERLLGLCCTGANKEPTKQIIDSLARRLRGSGFRLLIFQCFEDLYYRTKSDIGGAAVFELVNHDMLDAMIILPESLHDRGVIGSIVNGCRNHNLPVISVNEAIEGTFPVIVDSEGAFGAIVEHILSWHSCRRVKLIAGQKDNPFSQYRIDSCKRVMGRHGLSLSENDIYYCDFWEGPTFQAMDRFFESGEALPDVFICCNDSMAMAVCLKLRERGIKVPEDVLVTGFDGIETEKYHKPRLTTAAWDYDKLAEAVLEMAETIFGGDVQPFTKGLSYEPIFSESCGCACELDDSNRQLSDLVRSYSYSLNYEAHIDAMENCIAADPTPANVKKVLGDYCFANSLICFTQDFWRYLGACDGGAGNDMKVFLSTFSDGRELDDVTFPAARLIPQLENSFSEYNTLFVIPLHFQDQVMGYFVTHYAPDIHHNERMYTFCTGMNRCLETMRTHEHLAGLNRRLEFMFSHDQLTNIYNRYGFYNGFRESCREMDGDEDVFIISIDLNDMKYINDSFGHVEGDEALCITARALEMAADSCGGGVICSRFGGDEFVAAKVCGGDAQEQADAFRRCFDLSLEKLNQSSGKPYAVKVSFGAYAASLNGVDSIEGLIELADRLMYSDKAKHKRHPRNKV